MCVCVGGGGGALVHSFIGSISWLDPLMLFCESTSFVFYMALRIDRGSLGGALH